jgi:hypothetical protein
MADNVTITPGTGTTIATDEVPGGSGIQYQRIKIGIGADGAATDLQPASAAVQSALTGAQAIPVAMGGTWAVQNSPAVSTQATASKAAGAAGVRHVCTAVSFGFSASTAVAATLVTVNLRDGATGAGTVLWAWTFQLQAAAIVPFNVTVPNLSFVGTAATAMTLEFGALLTNLVQYVNLAGYDVS